MRVISRLFNSRQISHTEFFEQQRCRSPHPAYSSQLPSKRSHQQPSLSIPSRSCRALNPDAHPFFNPPLDTVATQIHPARRKISKSRGQLTLGGAASGASVAAHGNGHGLLGDVLEVGESLLQLHAVDGLSSLTGVLEADTQVRAPRAGALCVRNLLGGVTDLYVEERRSRQQSCCVEICGWWW